MGKARTFLNKWLHPPKAVLFFGAPVIFAALLLLFVAGKSRYIYAYPVYGMATYCLLIWIWFLVGAVRKVKAAGKKRLHDFAWASKYADDWAFRGKIGIYFGAAVSFFYVVFRTVLGIRYASGWFLSVAGYDLVLCGLRLLLIAGARRKRRERAYYRLVAWFLFLLNLSIGWMILQMERTDVSRLYPEYVVYLLAIYTFYRMIHAARNLAGYRKRSSPVLSAAKILDFVAAMISVLGLQTVMISRFSKGNFSYLQKMNAVTGAVIWGIVILIAVFMLWHSRNRKEGENTASIGK